MTPQQLNTMKLALEALGVVTKEMLAIRDELAEYGEGRPITNSIHQLLWDSSFKAYTETVIPAYAAIKEALAEHAMSEVQRLGQEIEQEPVAHWSDCAVHSEPAYPKGECDCGGIVAVADYTALADKYVALSDKYVALKEQHKEQEPVAWMWRCKPYCDWPNWGVSLKRPADSGCYGDKRTEGYEDVPLYTTPPQRTEQPAQRTWVGLTEQDLDYLCNLAYTGDEEFALAVQAKLMEKNA